jgi:hypothetical protein
MVVPAMNQRTLFGSSCSIPSRGVASAALLALTLVLPACGGATATGSAAGKMGRDLSTRSEAVPQGAEVCALKDALATQSGATPDKPMNDICGKARKSDVVWQGSMAVLGAYADTLDSLAAGGKGETSGPLEAAMTGITSDSMESDEPKEKGAREAALALVSQLAKNGSEGKLDKAVKDAAPHVKTICGGLVPYLEDQVKALADIQKELDKKRVARGDRRCGQLDSRNICVSESVIDRVVYANAFGHLATLETGHDEARRAVAGFCAAHNKLEEAAQSGDLGSDQTYFNIVDAVKNAHKKELPTISEPAAKK